jgi:hypothetical protein
MEIRKAITRLLLAAAALLPMICTGQGTFQFTHITFDGPPIVPPGYDIGVSQYAEQGMSFRAIGTSGQFGRTGGGISFFPENGTWKMEQHTFMPHWEIQWPLASKTIRSSAWPPWI